MASKAQPRPVRMRKYAVSYSCLSECEKMGERAAPIRTQIMDTDTLRYYLLSPGVIIQMITPEFSTFFN